ncbi:MAG TPA: 1-deoxy-D-xylulose-5-phosphate reductoisomerase [Phycisphaerales bacterium]|nr:1-deoxy-D-xylulose-5-phosphate reductoisomerase [Phycisphaerales bacterium]
MIQRRLIVLGSAGSIGVNTLEVVEHLRRTGAAKFEIVGLATGSNAALLAEQARRFNVSAVAIASHDRNDGSLDGIPNLLCGPDAAMRLVQQVAQPGDMVVGAMVGSAGIPATLEAINRGCDIALANKETLVAAGEIVIPRVHETGVALLPIDSEHSAIFQCLLGGRSMNEVRRLVITASGGPFRTWTESRIAEATVEQALNHPTWSMGAKITIDSASMMNKALEVIEAHWLFGLDESRIDVIIHPQSTVHSFVEFVDHSVLAQLGPPDMKTPIQYALTWPARAAGCSQSMDWTRLRSLEFEQVDARKFPAVSMAREVIRLGGTAGAIFNAANEAAVANFLARRIPFGMIYRLVRESLHELPVKPVTSIDDVFLADSEARRFVETRCSEFVQSHGSIRRAAAAAENH